MAETPKQTDGRVVDIRGLPSPVTDQGTLQRAQCELLALILDELRGIRADARMSPPEPEGPSTADTRADSVEPQKPRRGRRKKS